MRESRIRAQAMDYAVSILRVVEKLKERNETIVSVQLGASGVSIGAVINKSQAPDCETEEQLELLQDGVRVSGGLISFDAAAAGEVETTSMPNEITAIGSARVAVEAVTAITVTDGVVIIHRES